MLLETLETLAVSIIKIKTPDSFLFVCFDFYLCV